MGKKGIIGVVLILGSTIMKGLGIIFSITDTTEKTLTTYIESDDEEES